MNLYELSQEYLDTMELLADADYIPDKEIETALSPFKDSIETKAVNIVKFCKNNESDIEGLDLEIKRLQGKKKVLKGKVTRLKEYLRDNMERTKINKIQCELFTITCGAPSDIVEVYDVSLLPEIYVTKPDPVPIKAELIKALKTQTIPGARIVPGKSRLTIG